ncbi:MAG: hypothetical protein WDO56_23885 [Gammaproteobacteria bacterium]
MRAILSVVLATVVVWLGAAAWSAAGAAAAGAAATAEAGSLRFGFVLENDYATSAGVFDANGTLLRTLWSNRRFTAGAHEAVWDGRDDDGHAVSADADSEIRVLTHNVIYTWDGVIGNTSPDPTSPTHHGSLRFLRDLVVSGDRAFFTTPVEGPVPSMRYFRLDEPGSWHASPALPMANSTTMGLIAADEDRVYWAHDSSPWSFTWGKGGDQAFVMATDRDLSREIVFEAGTPTCVRLEGTQCYRDSQMDLSIRSAIDIVREVAENPATPIFEGARNNVTGLAVQKGGPLLFVAHGQLSPARIHVLDKRTGRELGRVPLPGVGRLVSGPGRDDLWAIHDSDSGRGVSQLRVGAAPGFALEIVRTLKGLEAPLTLALTPDGKQIVVADGASSQQLKAFDAVTGEALWQVGQPGGYAQNGPLVSPDKFSFHNYAVDSPTQVSIPQTVLSFAPDGSFWVGDTGLGRILKFSAERRYLDQIAFLPANYNVAADRNDPSRIFTTYLEYAVDYTKPIDGGWRLSRYFGDGPQIANGYHGFDAGFVDVATLRNGRTYGLLRSSYGVDVVEIPANGELKRFSLRLKHPVYLNKDGDLYSVRSGSAGRTEFWRRALTGFDDSGMPEWGREETTARVTRTVRDPRANPYQNSLERSVAEIEPNLHVLFDPANSDAVASPRQFHLAAIRSNESRLLWRASPASGGFDLAQPDGVFDDSHPWYAGMVVTAISDQIVYNYHGEGWRNLGQANQFLHWYRDGLFVGQFGVPNQREIPRGAPGLAGNSLSLQLVEANGGTYLWHNDENAHFGAHRWRLDGVEWMRELAGRGRPGQRIELARVAPARGAAHENAAPSALAAQAGTGRVQLTWRSSARGARGVEVQRLQPTYVGARFERIALLPPSSEAYSDTAPLSGEPTVYRVRALFSDGASDYSNHVHLTAPAKPAVLESQNFETPPPGLRDDFHLQPGPDIDVGVVADPANPDNHVLRVRARKPAGQPEFGARVRWGASPQLFRALNASLGKLRGSTPDMYRVQLQLRLPQAQLSAGSDILLQVDPGYDLFSTEGRRQSLVALVSGQQDRVKGQLVKVSFNFAALPNGAGEAGLQQNWSFPPTGIAVAFMIRLRGEGDNVEFLVDDFSVARL